MNRNPSKNEIELLKMGRHFRLDEHSKIVVGRNQTENEVIRSLSQNNDLILETVTVPGPTALLSGRPALDIEERAALITVSYSDARDDDTTEVIIRSPGNERLIEVKSKNKTEFKKWMI
jgi:predicted ribosome quality control (RQC) complex YloA/Tae2 family protein